MAKALGVSTGYVYQLVNGLRNMGEKTAGKFEARLNLPDGWLSTLPEGHASLDTTASRNSQHFIPVVTWESAPLGMDQPITLIPAAWDCAKTCFALEVLTEVMSPELPVGGYITVSPRHRPTNGDLVVYREVESSTATVRRLVTEGGVEYFQPANPQFPLVKRTDQDVLGTVMFYQRQFIKGK